MTIIKKEGLKTDCQAVYSQTDKKTDRLKKNAFRLTHKQTFQQTDRQTKDIQSQTHILRTARDGQKQGEQIDGNRDGKIEKLKLKLKLSLLIQTIHL